MLIYVTRYDIFFSLSRLQEMDKQARNTRSEPPCDESSFIDTTLDTTVLFSEKSTSPQPEIDCQATKVQLLAKRKLLVEIETLKRVKKLEIISTWIC